MYMTYNTRKHSEGVSLIVFARVKPNVKKTVTFTADVGDSCCKRKKIHVDYTKHSDILPLTSISYLLCLGF